MNDLIIPATPFTPEIQFRYSNGHLLIMGESYPENTSEFYKPIFQSLSQYLDSISDTEVTVLMYMRYFNSSSSKILINFFDLLEVAAKKGNTITVNWYYKEGDEDSKEFGEEFSEDLTGIRFNILPE